MVRFEIGKLYKIKFDDHSVGHEEHIECEAVGWVLDDNKHRVTLTSWRVTNSKDEQMARDNVEPFVIVKSCIIKTRKF